MKLADRVAVVTGGRSGIGRAVARLFAAEGARVIVAGRRAKMLDETLASLGSSPSRHRAIPTDVTDSASVKALFATVDREFGRLDVLVRMPAPAPSTTLTGSTGPWKRADVSWPAASPYRPTGT